MLRHIELITSLYAFPALKCHVVACMVAFGNNKVMYCNNSFLTI